MNGKKGSRNLWISLSPWGCEIPWDRLWINGGENRPLWKVFISRGVVLGFSTWLSLGGFSHDFKEKWGFPQFPHPLLLLLRTKFYYSIHAL